MASWRRVLIFAGGLLGDELTLMVEGLNEVLFIGC